MAEPQYYFASGNEQRGPYSLDELAALGLRPDALVWREGLAEWVRADALPELINRVPTASPAPAPAAPPPVSPQQPQPRQELIATPISYQSPTPLESQNNGMAVASMVLGIISLASLCVFHVGAIVGVPCAILAIVFGFLARGKARRGEGGGEGMALTGLICAFLYIALIIVIILLISVFAVWVIKSTPTLPAPTPAVPARVPTSWPSTPPARPDLFPPTTRPARPRP